MRAKRTEVRFVLSAPRDRPAPPTAPSWGWTPGARERSLWDCRETQPFNGENGRAGKETSRSPSEPFPDWLKGGVGEGTECATASETVRGGARRPILRPDWPIACLWGGRACAPPAVAGLSGRGRGWGGEAPSERAEGPRGRGERGAWECEGAGLSGSLGGRGELRRGRRRLRRLGRRGGGRTSPDAGGDGGAAIPAAAGPGRGPGSGGRRGFGRAPARRGGGGGGACRDREQPRSEGRSGPRPGRCGRRRRRRCRCVPPEEGRVSPPAEEQPQPQASRRPGAAARGREAPVSCSGQEESATPVSNCLWGFGEDPPQILTTLPAPVAPAPRDTPLALPPAGSARQMSRR